MNRALLVIDVQESFWQRPDWQTMTNPDIAAQVDRLVEAVRSSGDLVVWITHAEPGSGGVFDPASGFVQLRDGLVPRAGEPQIVKTSVNAFTTTNLQQVLTQRGITEVIVCGIRTEQCCETTARVASDLGYAVVFVTDATTTSPIPPLDAAAGQTIVELLSDPRTLSAQDIISRTERVLSAREFATIATTDQVVAMGAVLAR